MDKLGVVQSGTLADLILVNGNPLAKLDRVVDPAKNFDFIVMDGKFVKVWN